MISRRTLRFLLVDDDPRRNRGNELMERWINDILCMPENEPLFEKEIVAVNTIADCHLAISDLPDGQSFDMAIIDLRFPAAGTEWRYDDATDEYVEPSSYDMQGMELVRRYRGNEKVKHIIVCTGETSREIENEAVTTGAFECWSKPRFIYKAFQEQLESVFDLPSRFCLDKFGGDFARPVYQNARFGLREATKAVEDRLIGSSVPMQRVRTMIFEASQTDLPVLITGETGTGKEVVANLIHYLSEFGHIRHKDDPLVLNCGAYRNDELLRAELFGTCKGAFTDAGDRKGILEDQKETTLFLDEVGHASPGFQSLLLRAIENRRGGRMGSTKTEDYDIDLRFIAATDVDVFGSEQFSKAFLHRLAAIHIDMPPLRARASDIVTLLIHFWEEKVGRRPHLSVAACNLITNYSWPGNVRQLRSVTHVLAERCQRREPENTEPTVSRQDVERLLPNMGKKDEGDAVFSSFERYLAEGGSYDGARDRFLAAYVYHQHQRIAGGHRTNEAYRRTGEILRCSPSTVKARLRDYEEFREDQGVT